MIYSQEESKTKSGKLQGCERIKRARVRGSGKEWNAEKHREEMERLCAEKYEK